MAKRRKSRARKPRCGGKGVVKSGPRKGKCRKVKVGKCRQWALVHKPSLGRAVRTCVSRGKGRNIAKHAGSMVYGPLRPSGRGRTSSKTGWVTHSSSSGLLGLGDFLGFL